VVARLGARHLRRAGEEEADGEGEEDSLVDWATPERSEELLEIHDATTHRERENEAAATTIETVHREARHRLRARPRAKL
jgi:hypothetical protein